jgi:DNA mismatch repair protein MutL
MRQRIVSIFSGKTNEAGSGARRDRDRYDSWIYKPEFKKKRGEQFFFVNDRFIKAVICIMRLWLLTVFTRRRTTYFFLYLTVPPNTIDINIHPTKTEIKFDDEHALYAILRASIKHSLGSLT